jgi:hypothetical protein
MRRLFTTEEARRAGMTESRLRWGEKKGRWRRICRGVYGVGPHEPTPLDRARAVVLVTAGVASGHLAGVLYGLDSVELRADATVAADRGGSRPGVRRRPLDPARITEVAATACTDGLQTMVDLAGSLDDVRWEQALESALRKKLVTIGDLEALTPRVCGRGRINRVLGVRPSGAPPTESLLETLMVQLVRTVAALPPPIRQLDVFDEHGRFVARVDLAWPDLGIFVELDGQHHKGQPVYDANRETAVVAATGWLCGRFTWTEVVHHPRATARRLAAVIDQARRRPVAS